MKRILPAALVLVVLALIAGHVFLGTTVFRLYRAYNALRLDPLGLRSAPLPPSGHYDILLMGDSLAEQWTFPEGSVANAGRHAQTSAQILLRMQRLDADLHQIRGRTACWLYSRRSRRIFSLLENPFHL